MGFKLGICGTGQFAQTFIKLFARHPLVADITLCDLNPEKLRLSAEHAGISKTCPSLDQLCQSDVDAIALFTQNDRHARQALKALSAGKHVYSAVPAAITVAEMTDLVRAVESTGKIYMIGETSYYYPCTVYCRDRFAKGDFGQIVYGEAEYYHDFSHGLEEVCRRRFGKEWQRHAGMPPMFYPTHSTSMIVSVTGAHATQVCGMGIVYRPPPGETDFHQLPDAIYKNPFANETMLCRMSDGSVARINEFRRVGHSARRGGAGVRLYGTRASFEDQVGNSMWVTLNPSENLDITRLLDCPSDGNRPASRRAADGVPDEKGNIHSVVMNLSAVQHGEELPREFQNLPNGHMGSHHFLANEFAVACANRLQPRNNVWLAARYLLPGLIAHESALQGGTLMTVPDLGEPRGEVMPA